MVKFAHVGSTCGRGLSRWPICKRNSRTNAGSRDGQFSTYFLWRMEDYSPVGNSHYQNQGQRSDCAWLNIVGMQKSGDGSAWHCPCGTRQRQNSRNCAARLGSCLSNSFTCWPGEKSFRTAAVRKARIGSRTKVGIRMVNSAQISHAEWETVPPSGNIPCLRDMRACHTGRALPSRMMELSHDAKDQRTTLG